MWVEILSEVPRVFTPYNLLLLLGRAALTTLLLSAVGCLAGLGFGFGLALARGTRSWPLLPLRVLAFLYAEVVRRVPFLVTLMLFFFGAQVVGLDLAPLTVALIATSVISTAFVGEIVRAGLAAVRPAQIEAATVMNFSPWQRLRLVALPQAWPLILPPVFSYFVLFIKDTALASQIGVLELTDAGKILNTKGFSSFLVYGTVLVLYFMVSYPLARLGSHLEGRLGASRHPRARGALR